MLVSTLEFITGSEITLTLNSVDMVILCLGGLFALAKMNRAFISPVVRPNLPLRRPATDPGVVSPSCSLSPVPTELGGYRVPEQSTPEVKGSYTSLYVGC